MTPGGEAPPVTDLICLLGDKSTKDWPSDHNGLIKGQPPDNFDWAKKHDDLALFHTILEGSHLLSSHQRHTPMSKPKSRDLKANSPAIQGIIEKLDQPSWDEFVRLLLNATPSDIEDLVKPFHSQSMVLTKYCYQTLNKVKAEKKEPGILKSALAATEKALSTAADVVKNNNNLLKFKIDAAKKAAAESKFTAATAKITDCITAYTGKHTSVATDLATVKVTITNPPAGLNTSNQTLTIEKNCSASMLLSHSLIQLQKDFRGTLPHQCHLANPSKNNEVIAGTTLVNAIPDAIALVFKVYPLSPSLTHLY
ncbi:hypothetical protein BDN71DRAFT_1428562 [Pleurotus eryngii]|uniref:Uncharacterized protein n=1 Tax=Pleurotus eryngii TaxID=5323 RepID=A0A9P6A722_PLEER|nr:hypothetical protein BDN71DRAFT_1428562 [Pleurotus eryngii]